MENKMIKIARSIIPEKAHIAKEYHANKKASKLNQKVKNPQPEKARGNPKPILWKAEPN